MSTVGQFMNKVHKLPNSSTDELEFIDVYFARSDMKKFVSKKYHNTMIRIKPLAITDDKTKHLAIDCKELIVSYSKYDYEIYSASSNSKYIILRIENHMEKLQGVATSFYYPKKYRPADELPNEYSNEDSTDEDSDQDLDDAFDEVEFNKMLDSPKLVRILARIYNQLSKRTINIDLVRKILDERFHKTTTLEDIIDKAVDES